MPDGPSSPTVVIGIGNSMRRDDGVGPAAIARLDDGPAAIACLDDGAAVDLAVLDGESTRLLEAWRGRERAIVIDAARRGDPPGTIHRLVADTDPIPSPGRPASSHGAGLAEALELGRALDALPDRLVVFGVEPGDLSFGEGLSAPVRDALDELVARVRTEVEA